MRHIQRIETGCKKVRLGFWRLAARYWRTGAYEVRRSLLKGVFVRDLQRLVPEIRPADLQRAGSGVRAQALDAQGRLVDDFHVVRGERAIHVLNAPSPAATASLRIGEEIAGMAVAALGRGNTDEHGRTRTGTDQG